jgi:peptidoglycan hydrolase-like protein with peptidoglycan-binding domain
MRILRLAAPFRRPPALFAGSLLAVAAAIAANALFLQQRPHPAPLVATRETAVEPAAPRSDDLVLAVQSGLRRVGYYSGPLDGVAGPQTNAAILAFEAAAGRRQTGEASPNLLAAVRAAKASDATSLAKLAAGGEAESLAPDARVAAIQRAL